MRMVLPLVSVLMFSLPLSPAEASEWGCEVLLCAASDNPSWHGVESCHPPMERLISAMKRPGFSWPTCPEGGAGKPGFERYADCPAGWVPTEADQDFNHGRSDELSRCMRTVNACKAKAFQRYRDDGRTQITKDGVTRVYSDSSSCEYREYTARPLRDQPYYFDIESSGKETTERHYFDLRD
ncbi:hypothetical protein [Rhizobium sp. NXC24]|uniref:hypothetical protein n=1 Tax=Rhizobium sp. NXC24 TaxID=2048897 RepID=UPI000CF1CC90|nr:hypothetical protein [Rhizobium sp. NXC24]